MCVCIVIAHIEQTLCIVVGGLEPRPIVVIYGEHRTYCTLCVYGEVPTRRVCYYVAEKRGKKKYEVYIAANKPDDDNKTYT